MLSRRALLGSLAPLPFLSVLPARAAAPLPAVATISILADLVRQTGGDAVALTALVPPDGDAHTYEPRPSDLTTLHGAALLVENGLGLEGWMDRLRGASGFAGVRVEAAAQVTPRHFTEDGRITIDPHAWQDPRNAIRYVQAIADGLTRAAPEQATRWHARAADYAAEIAATDRWIAARIATVPPAKRKIVTSHDAFGYYGDRYGIALHFVEGLSTDDEPSAKDMARLIDDIRAQGIRAVFIENMTDPRLIRAVAHDAHVIVGPVVYSDALSPPGGPADTYLKMLRHNTTAFVVAMQRND